MNLDVVEFAARALDRRRDLIHRLIEEKTEAIRVFGGDPEGIRGLTVDIFSRVGFFFVQMEDCRLAEGDLVTLAEWYLETGMVDSVYLKRLGRERFKEQPGDDLRDSLPLAGMTAPSRFVTHEWGTAFLIRPYDGFQVGLFPDQRDNRRFLAVDSKGKRVLNLFSYTCAFSVACAMAGAETTSVDLSRKYLEWGKENFSLNGLAVSEHRFFSADASEFLRRTTKREERYDLIILDPPSFARRPKGKSFSLEQEFNSLFVDAVNSLSLSGMLFFSSNLARWTQEALNEKVKSLESAETGRLEPIPLPGLAADYRMGEQTLHNILVAKKP